jgi:hypothetical protein
MASGLQKLSVDSPGGNNSYQVDDLSSTGIKEVSLNLHEQANPDQAPDHITVNAPPTADTVSVYWDEKLAGKTNHGSGSSVLAPVTHVTITTQAAVPDSLLPGAGTLTYQIDTAIPKPEDDLHVNTFGGNDVVTIRSTQPDITVPTTGGHVYVNTGAGDDTITVGDANNGGLNNFFGPLDVDAGAGHNQITFDDSGSLVHDTVTLTASQLIRYTRTATVTNPETEPQTGYPFIINYQASHGGDFLQGVVFNTSLGSTDLYLPETGTNASVTVNARGGLLNSHDKIYVGFDGAFPAGKNQLTIQNIPLSPLFPTTRAASTLDFLASPLIVSGLPGGHTALEVDDEAAPAGETYTLRARILSPQFGFLTRPRAPVGALIIYGGSTLDFTLNAGNKGNTIDVQGVDPGTSATINAGQGNDAIVVTDGSESLNSIGGPLTIDGGSGSNTLVIDDRGSGVSQTYALSTSQFLRQGNPAVLINYSDLSSLDFYASDDAVHNLLNGIIVSGMKAGSLARTGAATVTFDQPTFLTLYLALVHNNTFGVQATAAGTTVQVYAGNATNAVLVGDPTTKTVDAIQGPLAIHGGSGPANVTVDDRGANPHQSYALTAAALFRPAGHSLLTFTALNGLVLETGAQATVAVQSTAQGTDVTVKPGAGTNTISVGSAANSLGTIQGPLAVVGQSGTDVLTLNDQGSLAFGYNYVLTPVQVTGSGAAAISYAKMGSLVLNGSQGLGTYTVQGLPANTRVTFNASGAGAALYGPNQANTWAITGAGAGTLDTRLTFTGFLGLVGGSGDDTFAFQPGGSVFFLLGGGGVDTLDYSALSTSVVVDLQTGVATGVSSFLSGMKNVIGGSGGPAGTYNLLIGAGGGTLKGGTGRRNILVAGGSAATLVGGNQDDLLIAGRTVYDTQLGLASWLQIAAYWAGANNTDNYATRVANLEAGNGVQPLDGITVTGNGGGNHLSGQGELALIFTDGLDTLLGFKLGSQKANILP